MKSKIIALLTDFGTRDYFVGAVKGVGEARWATPVRRNAMAVPLKEKVDLLLDAAAKAVKTVMADA